MNKNKYYCRINGTIENLKDIQDILDGKSQNNIISIMYEKFGFEPLDALQFEDVIKFNNNEIPADYNECLKRMQDYNQRRVQAMDVNKPHCPHCNSTNISQISTAERVGSIAMLGIFSKKINKSFKCKSCGYTW